ncbi:HNH endonuclease [Acidocella aromatica]|uniref:Putative restriction endonuclease n=1 Tax=Acidocella aromatica TaxID=1303579 RepID=A0A840VKD1_9PROT|nr:HNH endonuclease [Acidocella aromatica]MBB5371960.1 putative restriction endonuclease [Acidocella aromatica]
MRTLVVYWKSGEAKGYSDLLPCRWFEAEGEWPSVTHDILGPRNGKWPAKFTLTVKGDVALFDYAGKNGEHISANENYTVCIGTLKIVFKANSSRTIVRQILWRNHDDKKFQTADVDYFEQDLTEKEDALFNPLDLEDGRKWIKQMIVLRRGQSSFRKKLMIAYESRCAITGCTIPEVLEAAHISPYMGDKTNHVTNGLLLRADIHTLFDCGLIEVSRDYKIIAPDHIRTFYQLPERITLPHVKRDWPNQDALEQKLRDD